MDSIDYTFLIDGDKMSLSDVRRLIGIAKDLKVKLDNYGVEPYLNPNHFSRVVERYE